MRYIGSKAASVSAISSVIAKHAKLGLSSFADPFAGICTVSKHFKALGYRVITGDVLRQSYLFQLATIELNNFPRFSRLRKALRLQSTGNPAHCVIEYLNGIPGKPDYVTRHFSLFGPARRRFFTQRNAKRIDAVRNTIAAWSEQGLISRQEEAYLLVSLLNALDDVANTAGTYYAYLKRFYRKAKRPLLLRSTEIINNHQFNKANQATANELLEQYRADIVYLDPPYNARDYGSYYHLTESIATWNKPMPSGLSGIPKTTQKVSPFCRPREAESALAALLAVTKAKLILVHYATDGLIRHKSILSMLRERGDTNFVNWKVRRYSALSNNNGICGHRLYSCVPRD